MGRLHPCPHGLPGQETGRPLHRLFRGLLGLHARSGPLDRAPLPSTAPGSLCPAASTRPVALPGRSSASGSIDTAPDGPFLPLSPWDEAHRRDTLLAEASCRMSRRGLSVRGRARKLFFKFRHRWALSDPEIFYPALADRWPTAFQRVGAEPWVLHGPGPLRPGPQRTWTESASWKAEGAAVSSRSARAKKGQIEEQNRTVRAGGFAAEPRSHPAGPDG